MGRRWQTALALALALAWTAPAGAVGRGGGGGDQRSSGYRAPRLAERHISPRGHAFLAMVRRLMSRRDPAWHFSSLVTQALLDLPDEAVPRRGAGWTKFALPLDPDGRSRSQFHGVAGILSSPTSHGELAWVVLRAGDDSPGGGLLKRGDLWAGARHPYFFVPAGPSLVMRRRARAVAEGVEAFAVRVCDRAPKTLNDLFVDLTLEVSGASSDTRRVTLALPRALRRAGAEARWASGETDAIVQRGKGPKQSFELDPQWLSAPPDALSALALQLYLLLP